MDARSDREVRAEAGPHRGSSRGADRCFRHQKKAALRLSLQEAHEYTNALVSDLTDAQLRVPQRPTLNPFLWEFGHVGWFSEYFVLREGHGAVAHGDSLLAGADRWYDSSRVPHATRWSLDLPSREATRAYLNDVLERTLAALDEADDDDAGLYRFRLALAHADMHGEAFAYMRNSLGYPAPGRLARRGELAPMAAHCTDVEITAGTVQFGSRPGDGFVFDNEKWAHEVELAGFAIASRPVNNGEFAAFIDAGGYRRDEFWGPAGRNGSNRLRAVAPRQWRRVEGGWNERWFDYESALDPLAPVQHLTAHEADAWCRWAGRRLPTELEWETAAVQGAIVPQGVWEWTASEFAPLPGFSADAYADYSAPWFSGHRVLRGASVATAARQVHPRYRNFFLPERDDIFSGLRTCALSQS
jgi:gamma-glutamyl hercynylcysteine S-oxide synthase